MWPLPGFFLLIRSSANKSAVVVLGWPEFLPGKVRDLAVDVDGEDVRLVGVILVIGVVG